MSAIQYITPGTETNAQYHSSGAWGSSALKVLLESGPVIARLNHEQSVDKKTTLAMEFGTAFHSMMAGDMASEVSVTPPSYKTRIKMTKKDAKAAGYTKDNLPPSGTMDDDGFIWIDDTKEWHNGATECAAWVAARQAEGRVVISPSQLRDLTAMADSVRANPEVSARMRPGDLCEVGFRKDMGTFSLQCRWDRIALDFSRGLDWKTIDDIDKAESAIEGRKYYLSWFLYRSMVHEYTGKWPIMDFVFVEKKPPYRCRLIEMHDDWQDEALHGLNNALTMLVQCYVTDDWSDREPKRVSRPSKWRKFQPTSTPSDDPF